MNIHKNPEEFIAKTADLINQTKASLIINNIIYQKIGEEYDAKTVFTNNQSTIWSDQVLKKHIYDFLVSDSQVEKNFVKELESADEVCVYAKLPSGFRIATPVANYTPDWAIVLDKEKIRSIYFVAETKGSMDENELKATEKLKIHCAIEHFKTISGGEVKFRKINNYQGLLEMVEDN